MRHLDPAWSALAVSVALVFVGRGYLNGDIAAYVAQGWSGDLANRFTHVGYTGLATVLAPLAGRELPVALDVVNVVAAGLACAFATRLTRHARGWVGLAAACIALPWAPFAEVDLPWIAAVLGAAVGVPGSAAVAVALSPTALLALPWAAWHRRHLGPLLEGTLVVGVLTLASHGAWWWGPRGVLTPHPWLIGRNLGNWLVTVPWWLVVTGRPPRMVGPVLAVSPLLVAPADVPTGVLVAVIATAAALQPTRTRHLRALALAIVAVGAWQATRARADRVATEHRAILTVLRRFDPGDGLVAPFTWGARAAVIATDDPYGLAWHPEGRFLRDQAIAWRHVDGTIWVLPPHAPATPEP